MSVSSVPYLGSEPVALGDVGKFEPSGLAMLDGVLYMVSDEGSLTKYDAATQKWQKVFKADDKTFALNKKDTVEPDLESITVAKDQLMIGVEGDDKNSPQIARFSLSKNTFSSSWSLEYPGEKNKTSGMEALTFVPKEYCPAFNASADGPYYGGYFFVAFQNLNNKIYVYDLPKGGGTMGGKGGAPVWTYQIEIGMQVSDLCFANGVLYVLFDGGGTEDLLAVYTTHTSTIELTFQKQYQLPLMPKNNDGTRLDYEGLEVVGQTMYLARDSRDAKTPNGVYELLNTSIYPNATLPPTK